MRHLAAKRLVAERRDILAATAPQLYVTALALPATPTHASHTYSVVLVAPNALIRTG